MQETCKPFQLVLCLTPITLVTRISWWKQQVLGCVVNNRARMTFKGLSAYSVVKGIENSITQISKWTTTHLVGTHWWGTIQCAQTNPKHRSWMIVANAMADGMSPWQHLKPHKCRWRLQIDIFSHAENHGWCWMYAEVTESGPGHTRRGFDCWRM